MSFLDRLRGSVTGAPSTKTDALTLHAGGSVHVVGESYRQDLIARVAANASDVTPFLEELKGRSRSAAIKDTKKR